MSRHFFSLSLAPPGGVVGDLLLSHRWPVVALSACAAPGLASQRATPDAGNSWLRALLVLAAALLPPGLGRQLLRQSNVVADQARRLRHQHSRLQQQRVASAGRDAAPQRCAAGGQGEVVLAGLGRCGSGPRWWQTTVFPFTDLRGGGPHGAALVLRGSSTHQQAARALVACVDPLRLALNTAGRAVFVCGAARPHALQLFNNRTLQRWGIPPDQAAGLTPAGGVATGCARLPQDGACAPLPPVDSLFKLGRSKAGPPRQPAPAAAPSPPPGPDSAATPPPPDAATSVQPAPADPAPAAPLRVLYIDDNAVNTLLMAAMFERLPGLSLRCESDPYQALAVALADPPALMLVDIQMPGMDGYQLLRRLRADPATREMPAIAVSANAMPQDLARGRAAGFADYLTKPLDLQRLQSALQAALPGWAAPG